MKKNRDVLIVGFALFAIFFGAGNLIFPPFIGLTSGSSFGVSFLGFIIADVGIIFLSILAVAKSGSLQNVIGRAGKNFGITLEVLMMLCLGPMLVVPRTSATTFEMSIAPLFEGFNPYIFSIIFFTLVLVLSIKQNKVIDIMGKFLTPILLIALAVLIIKGIITPIGEMKEVSETGLFVTGLTQGYQTMDALGIGGIVALIMAGFYNRGYSNKNEVLGLTIKAALVACIGLTIVYGCLTYLGATVSGIYDTSISQTALLVNITENLLGRTGIIILAIIVGLACLTTAVGLTSVTAKYFEDLTNKKVKYKTIVLGICLFSGVISNLGVDKIIQIAVPILSLIYPVTIVLVVMNIFGNKFKNDNVFKGAAYMTILISLLTVLDSLGISIELVNKLPLARLGLNWVIPAIIGGVIGSLFSKNKDEIKVIKKEKLEEVI